MSQAFPIDTNYMDIARSVEKSNNILINHSNEIVYYFNNNNMLINIRFSDVILCFTLVLIFTILVRSGQCWEDVFVVWCLAVVGLLRPKDGRWSESVSRSVTVTVWRWSVCGDPRPDGGASGARVCFVVWLESGQVHISWVMKYLKRTEPWFVSMLNKHNCQQATPTVLSIHLWQTPNYIGSSASWVIEIRVQHIEKSKTFMFRTMWSFC